MSRGVRVMVVVALMGAVATVLALKNRNQEMASDSPAAETYTRGQVSVAPTLDVPDAMEANAETTELPRLVDLGAGKCIPCKLMAPILDSLNEDFAGTFDVEFIDVWENPDAGDEYGVRIIPTQIFYDSQGQELFRHEGFFSREDILGKWKDLGHDMQAGHP